jgi:hypothetical protein
MAQEDKNELLKYFEMFKHENQEVKHSVKCFAYPFGPASPSPRTRRVLPLLTPGGIFTLISFLTRIRPSPEHFLQYSEMTSPSPAQVGQIETYKIKINK